MPRILQQREGASVVLKEPVEYNDTYPAIVIAHVSQPRTEHVNLNETIEGNSLGHQQPHQNLQQHYTTSHSKNSTIELPLSRRGSHSSRNGPPTPSLEKKPKRGTSFLGTISPVAQDPIVIRPVPSPQESTVPLDPKEIKDTTLCASDKPEQPEHLDSTQSLACSTNEESRLRQTYKLSRVPRVSHSVAIPKQKQQESPQHPLLPQSEPAQSQETALHPLPPAEHADLCTDVKHVDELPSSKVGVDRYSSTPEDLTIVAVAEQSLPTHRKSADGNLGSTSTESTPAALASDTDAAGDDTLIEENLESFQAQSSQRRMSTKDQRRKRLITFLRKAVSGGVYNSFQREGATELSCGETGDEQKDDSLVSDTVDSMLPEPAYSAPRIEQKKRRSIFSALSGSTGTGSKENLRTMSISSPMTASSPTGLAPSTSLFGSQLQSSSFGGSTHSQFQSRLSSVNTDSNTSVAAAGVAGPNAAMLAMAAFAAAAASQHGNQVHAHGSHSGVFPMVGRSRQASLCLPSQNSAPTNAPSASVKIQGNSTRSTPPIHSQLSHTSIMPPPPLVSWSLPGPAVPPNPSSYSVLGEIGSSPPSPSIVRVERLQRRQSIKTDIYAKRIVNLEEAVALLQSQVAQLMKVQEESRQLDKGV
ncbi:hypothetical protein BASA61_001317 [Batrachochytrium salamandrivorans]|nr:hypothetical protein BASA61_001317 [Batrachochytrium salamandrivorans]